MWPVIIIGLAVLLALLVLYAQRQSADVSSTGNKEPGDWWGPWMGPWSRSGGNGAAWCLKGDQGR